MKQARSRFREISRQCAIRMVLRAIGLRNASSVTCHEERPPSCGVLYHRTAAEPCWYVFAPWNDGRDGLALRSSRVIVIGRKSGITYYDGSARDEG